MEALFAKVVEILQLAPRYLAPVGLVAAVLLFSPPEWLEKVGVAQLAQDNRPVLGVALLFSGAVTLLAGAGAVLRGLRRWNFRRKRSRSVVKRLMTLTEDEKHILRYYIRYQTRSNTLRPHDGVVQGLVSAGLIYRAANLGSIVEGFAFNITEEAWQLLNEHQGLLDGDTTTIRTDSRAHTRMFR